MLMNQLFYLYTFFYLSYFGPKSIIKDIIEKKVNDIKASLHRKTILASHKEMSLYQLWITRYRRPLFIGLFTIVTGSLLWYKYAANNDHNQ